MKKISVSIICENESENIDRLINSLTFLSPAIDKIVFIDNFSSDDTLDKVKEYQKHLPINIFQSTLTSFANQKNIGISRCTGDWILSIDADMTFTKNFLDVFNSGFFESHDVWDFDLFYTVIDKYNHTVEKNFGMKTTRFFRNKVGLAYQWDVHEHIMYPTEVTGIDYSTDEGKHRGFNYMHQPHILGICNEIVFFENSLLMSDEALKDRGERRMKWAEKSKERGISYNPNDYVEAKRRANDPAIYGTQVRRFVDPLLSLIP